MSSLIKSITDKVKGAVTTEGRFSNALNGNGLFDPANFFTETQLQESDRRRAYYLKYIDAYEGKLPIADGNDGDDAIVINYNRPFINKSADWLFSSPWEIEVPDGNDLIVDKVYKVLQENNMWVKSWQFGQSGGIAGDAYLHMYLDGESNDPLKKNIIINYLKPTFVYPLFHPINTDRLVAVLIQYPIDTSGNFAVTYQVPSGRSLYTQLITEDYIYEYVNDRERVRTENPFGTIPVYHAPNLMNAFRWYGDSDLQDTYILNQFRDDTINLVKKIINYHSDPLLFGKGMRASKLEKGAGKFWTTSNTDAELRYIEMQSDLGPAMGFIDDLKKSIEELASIPHGSLGEEQAISNTSAAALEVRYMTLLEKTKRKRLSYGRALANLCKDLVRFIVAKDPAIISKIEQPDRFDEVTIKFANPLPRDINEVLAQEEQKLRIGIQSRYGALKQITKKDLDAKVLEIIADDRHAMLEDVERARSVEGQVPNLHVNFTGSLGMHAADRESIQKIEDKLVTKLYKDLQETERVNAEAEKTLVQKQNQNIAEESEDSSVEE